MGLSKAEFCDKLSVFICENLVEKFLCWLGEIHLYSNSSITTAKISLSFLFERFLACFSWIIKHNLKQKSLGFSEKKRVLSGLFNPDASIILSLKVSYEISIIHTFTSSIYIKTDFVRNNINILFCIRWNCLLNLYSVIIVRTSHLKVKFSPLFSKTILSPYFVTFFHSLYNRSNYHYLDHHTIENYFSLLVLRVFLWV